MTGSPEVFINCPFDATYAPLFRAVVFTLIRLDCIPRCALEEDGSSRPQLEKILELIEASRLGIHDLSMQSLDVATGLPRFNMPFEPGLFLGCRHFGGGDKKLLVPDSDQYRFRASLSDFAGHNIKCHDGDPASAIAIVRNWLANALEARMYGAVLLQSEFLAFASELPASGHRMLLRRRRSRTPICVT